MPRCWLGIIDGVSLQVSIDRIVELKMADINSMVCCKHELLSSSEPTSALAIEVSLQQCINKLVNLHSKRTGFNIHFGKQKSVSKQKKFLKKRLYDAIFIRFVHFNTISSFACLYTFALISVVICYKMLWMTKHCSGYISTCLKSQQYRKSAVLNVTTGGAQRIFLNHLCYKHCETPV